MTLQGNWDRTTLTRRRLLGWAGMGAGGLAVAASGYSPARASARPFFADYPFTLGVASGDPLPDGVVLWTRLAPDPLAPDGNGGLPPETYGVRFEVAEDERFSRVVRRGAVEATPELAHSVHVEVQGLGPGREYFYRFKAGPEISPVGRTKTAPALGAAVDRFAAAFASSQHYITGFYAAYRDMPAQELDLVVHLGDYIYADASGGRDDPDAVRFHSGPRATTLEEYRVRYGDYKTDADLRAAHAAAAFVVTFDDHEVKNGWADESARNTTPEAFLRQRAAAFQAYYEHMPLRRTSIPRGPDMQLYRRISFGDMVEFNVLDTRQYRDRQTDCSGEETANGYCASATDPGRTILGEEQERWLLDGLGSSTARWNVLAQQIIFAQKDNAANPDKQEYVGGGDQWDGYKADRDTVLEFVQARRPSNPMVITGDIHTNNVYDLKADFSDPDSETLGSEFVGTSISSGGDPGNPTTTDGDRTNDPHHLFFNNNRGYVRCTLTPERWQTDFRIVTTVLAPEAPVSTLATFVVEDGQPGAKRA